MTQVLDQWSTLSYRDVVRINAAFAEITAAIAGLSGGGGPAINAAVTPHAGGGQALATQLSAGYTFVNEPSSDHDSVALPNATAGAVVELLLPANRANEGFGVEIFVKNGSTDTILGTAFPVYWLDSSRSGLAPTISLRFWCSVAGNWLTNGNLDN